jgi:RimJ/RimL family protein N-acetyltransferase
MSGVVDPGRRVQPAGPALPGPAVPEWLRSAAGDVVLRRPRPEDLAALAGHVGADGGWLSAPAPMLADPLALLDEYQAGWSGRPNRLGLTMVVADPVTDRFTGVMHLSRLGDDAGLWVRGGVDPDVRGRHVAQRALSLLCAWALMSGGYPHVMVEVDAGDEIGQWVVERCGFRRLRRDRIVVKPTKQRLDLVVYTCP